MHTILMNKPVKLFPTREAAREAAAQLTSGELDDWCYRVERDPGDRVSYVLAVYDESGSFVSYWRES